MSSLASHFGTNYTPTDDELMEMSGLLIASSARLAELDAELEQKVAECNAIAEKRAKVEREIADYRALASPMRRFPVDLLREVFLHCLPTNHNAILSRNRAPMLLTYVCSAWRAIVLDTPALWASFHIPVPSSVITPETCVPDLEWEQQRETVDVIQKRTRTMQEWLVRSGTCGLNISLHDMDHFAELWKSNTNYEAFLYILKSHSKRWRSMTFIAPVKYLRHIAKLTADEVPALEELDINMSICYRDGGTSAMVEWANSSFLSAPRLHRVSFNNLAENINVLPIRWRQLTHISLTGSFVGENMSLANISALLAKCPRLISARLKIEYNNAPNAELSPFVCTSPIVLPDLVDLTLLNCTKDSIPSLFAMLDVPRLGKLEYYTSIIVEPAGELIALLTRVSETLINFTTDALRFSRVDFFAMLKAACRLRSLSSSRRQVGIVDLHNWIPYHQRVQHFDDVFLGMLVGRRLGQSNPNAEGATKLQEGKTQEVEEVAEGYSRILLPELENFDCHRPVIFTEDGLLECLELRQNPGHDIGHPAGSSTPNAKERTNIDRSTVYTKFKRFSVTFSRLETRPMSEEVSSFRKAGLALNISHEKLSLDSLLPTKGIREETASIVDL